MVRDRLASVIWTTSNDDIGTPEREKSQGIEVSGISKQTLLIFLASWFLTFGLLAVYIYQEKTHVHMGNTDYYWAGMAKSVASDGNAVYSPIYMEVNK
jgi:hypothetical protein